MYIVLYWVSNKDGIDFKELYLYLHFLLGIFPHLLFYLGIKKSMKRTPPLKFVSIHIGDPVF